MSNHPTLASLLAFNGKLARLSMDKFPPLALVRSQRFSSICPSYLEYKIHSHSGEGRLVMAMSLTNQRIKEISDAARDAIFQCNLCGGCDVSVKLHSDIETVAGMYALRAESFRRAGPLPGHHRLLERLDEVGHPLFVEGRKGDWIRESGRATGMNGAKTLLFVGDRYALQPNHRKTLLHLVELLERTGVAFGLLGDDEPSTGRVALDIGDEERFDRQARKVAAAIRASGADTVLCADALDFNTIRAHLPKVADLGGVKSVHAVEVLDELIAGKKLVPRRPLQARVAYHDPDTLGRLSEPFQPWEGEIKKVMGQLVVYDPPRPVNRGTYGVYDPPRRLLAAIPGVELVEFYRRREYAFSCADEDVLRAAGWDEFVDNTARHRMEEAREVGAQIVASACPSSEDNLAAVAPDFSIRIANVVDLLHASVTG
jgi:heterodisulfide reductase subunit D